MNRATPYSQTTYVDMFNFLHVPLHIAHAKSLS